MGGVSKESFLISVVIILMGAAYSLGITTLSNVQPMQEMVSGKTTNQIDIDSDVYNLLQADLFTAPLVYRVLTTYEISKDEHNKLKIKIITSDGDLQIQNDDGDLIEENIRLLLTKYSSKYFTAKIDDTDSVTIVFTETEFTGTYKEIS